MTPDHEPLDIDGAIEAVMGGLGVGGNGHVRAPGGQAAPGGEAQSGAPAKASQATRLVEIAHERFELGFATSGEPFAVARGGARVALMFRGGRTSLRAALADLYAEEEGRVPSSSALADALLCLEGRAQKMEPVELALRVAAAERDVVLDLGTGSGEVVVISPGLGWQVTRASPVLFRRTELTAPLPVPVAGGRLDELRSLVNASDDTWPLLLAWLVMALLPNVPHPILLLRGEQGAGKSTAARLLASLVDPSPAPLRTAPSDVEAWAVAAAGSWIVPVDNVTTIAPWLSDALCRAVTGDGLVKRRLYSDSGLVVLAIRRAIILTSIDAGALRGDLADRLLPVDLERLGERERRLDEDLTEAFERSHSGLLGALCTLASDVLAVLPTVQLPTMPRMADAARVMAAVDRVLGTDSLGTYLALGKRVAAEVVEGDPVAQAVRALVERAVSWRGTPTELLDELRPEHPGRGWPADATRLAGRLRRAAPTLRSVGVEVEQLKVRGARVVRLSQGDAEAFQGDADLSSVTLSVTLEGAGQPLFPPQGDAEDAETPTPICRSQMKRGGSGAPNGDGANPASLASQRHPGGQRCARCMSPLVYLTAHDGRPLCRPCVYEVAAEMRPDP